MKGVVITFKPAIYFHGFKYMTSHNAGLHLAGIMIDRHFDRKYKHLDVWQFNRHPNRQKIKKRILPRIKKIRKSKGMK